jgi:N6-L-threonylcarbamoyladenine synthase
VGALLIGLSAAKAIAFAMDKPLIGVHHIEGHIAANYLEHLNLEPPFICLVASGGHSHIVNVTDYNSFEVLGQTRDDAAGEAFDKIARALGLGYPGGPIIDTVAQKGNPLAINFPRVSFGKDNYDFSFSGLKTSVLNYLNTLEQKSEKCCVEDVCASFQQAIVDVLVKNTIAVAKLHNIKKIALAGGVASNSALRKSLSVKALEAGCEIYYPRPILCTDNAAMIACAAYYEFLKGNISGMELNAVPGLRLGQR